MAVIVVGVTPKIIITQKLLKIEKIKSKKENNVRNMSNETYLISSVTVVISTDTVHLDDGIEQKTRKQTLTRCKKEV